ncbi:hypothetical protein [Streptacidiphilus jiangxiensis]|uniref:Uncharacterized protein n=1 Tax=Streptacidiphilus jiangxiensis TaxID=235985 RepID=A0A1H7N7C4_STRJI|nr:hypothetical protein [Streptacidiphilus jiangxiensis]SEL19413.1 hypothetical protein SAMN05414137_106242 [Streptacidiphilus jiangxiensis]
MAADDDPHTLSPGTDTDADPDAAEGLRMLEGYLYWQAETARAQRDAERFADLLPWLTSGQREDVIRLYRQERLDSSRAFVDRVAHRARQLQREYGDRYRHLKLRLVAAAFTAAAGLVAAEAYLHPIG